MARKTNMRWFGRHWGSVFNDSCDRRLTPFWLRCHTCDEWIKLGDRGVTVPVIGILDPEEPLEFRMAAYHLDCFLKGVAGGAMAAHAMKAIDDEES